MFYQRIEISNNFSQQDWPLYHSSLVGPTVH